MKKIINKLLSLLFLASFPMTHEVLCCDKGLVSAGSETLETRFPQAITFVKKEIAAAGIDPRFIGIAAGTRWHCKWHDDQHQYVIDVLENDGFSLKALEAMLANNGDVSAYQFIIAHEINHLLCNHAHKRAMVQVANDAGVALVALVTHTLIYCKTHNLGATAQLAWHAVAAIVEYGFTKNPAVYAYIRSLEQEADDKVRNDINVLKGGITFLEAHSVKEAPETCLKWVKSLLNMHPEIKDRVARLQERITALEAMQQLS